MVKLGDFVIGIFVFSLFILVFSNLITELNATFTIQMNDTFDNSYDRILEIGNVSQSMTDQVVGATIDDADPSSTLSINMLSALKLIYLIPSMIYDFLEETFEIIPVDARVKFIILGMILVMITLLIISTVFGFKVF